ncbi:hypothetical protein [Fictibacillus sp. KU28468]|uniref:hypothetical protein n=1 Tax=Fictibacillus sp. KU28468 TaxID=2991053 RepID=UPI00223D5828|nr:hypothetical protein [Fictibacillus sp. KU28468]UZJ78515.1 hypothetical protein OKX00_20710 [Fictibacillus sp. KU28468]
MTVYLSSQTIRVFINRPAQEVYEYAYNMENFPQWVSYPFANRFKRLMKEMPG